MTRALDAARYLIRLATPSEDENADCLCHMRLQKLLYYVQGWHLAAVGVPLFPERIEAWRYGPVVKSLYPTFKEFRLAIPSTEGEVADTLTIKDRAFIASIWDIYKVYSATALRDMTHRETPWVVARGNLPPEAASETEITTSDMREFFFPRYVEMLRRKDSRVNPGEWLASTTAVDAGRVRTVKDIRRGLRDRHTRADPR